MAWQARMFAQFISILIISIRCSSLTHHNSSTSNDVCGGSICYRTRARRSPFLPPSRPLIRSDLPLPPCAEGCCGRSHVCGQKGCAFKLLCGIDCCPPHIAQELRMTAQRLTLADTGLAPDHQRNTLPISINHQSILNTNNDVFTNGHVQFRSFNIKPEQTPGPLIPVQNTNSQRPLKQVHPSFINTQQQHTAPYMQQIQLPHQQQYQNKHSLLLQQQPIKKMQLQPLQLQPVQHQPHPPQQQHQQLRLYLEGPLNDDGLAEAPTGNQRSHPHSKSIVHSGMLRPNPNSNGLSGTGNTQLGSVRPSIRGGFIAAVNERRAVQQPQRASNVQQQFQPGKMTFSSKANNKSNRPPPGKSIGPRRPPAFTARPPSSIDSPVVRPAAFGGSHTFEQMHMPYMARTKRCCDCCMPDCNQGCIRNGGCGMCQALTGTQHITTNGISKKVRTKKKKKKKSTKQRTTNAHTNLFA